jgi:hypothetical protein
VKYSYCFGPAHSKTECLLNRLYTMALFGGLPRLGPSTVKREEHICASYTLS